MEHARVFGTGGRTVKRYCVSCGAPVYVRPDSADAWGDEVRCTSCRGAGRDEYGRRIAAAPLELAGDPWADAPFTHGRYAS